MTNPQPILMPNADFEHVPLHVHRILPQARLMDVWAVPLVGGGAGRTIADVLDLLSASQATDIRPMVRALFAVRELMGRVLGWDSGAGTSADSIPPSSYLHRLPPELLKHSLDEPGTPMGPVRVLYRLDDEALAEVINMTSHAFVCFALLPQDNSPDYLALLAVYVIKTQWWTPYYLALIEPFRRWIVYPSLMKTLQRRWQTLPQTGARA